MSQFLSKLANNNFINLLILFNLLIPKIGISTSGDVIQLRS